MSRYFFGIIGVIFFAISFPAHAESRVSSHTIGSSYVPGYGRLVYDDPFVSVYDNTGQYTTHTAKYRSSRRSDYPYGRSTTKKTLTGSKYARGCLRPDHHIPKCYVYDNCTYDELYGDGYWEQQCPADYDERDDVRYHVNQEHSQVPLRQGPSHRSRPYPLYSRDNYEYQNSFNHYDSYWSQDEYGTVNDYEYYDY
ncbi:hypothetical protein COU78_03755 [Candidatus Peregrinibacteria bacterium CG10_big_fil_rev_8_21_14_0_10_49_24]|nr:MAG: hypothetical protein COV83_05575 [Candidatus Peregrinibacteria bacterium CG11_big_fil_rev_8_21_14_0_20_49_14]PIR51232.1 MAG: hypothetical protein COU78_03755 [Candidatus Peregrinibacteria bacterium CG10_big_fil_rev_8_21_14_0_10_49_24]PJA67270.1 MAG: hypothetical protein CO157_05910 [Candidatus Peregrinibacteria bacterium CG_4_9_14_3_um_filter_49_12]